MNVHAIRQTTAAPQPALSARNLSIPPLQGNRRGLQDRDAVRRAARKEV
jgi:hypothetical protein